MGNKPNAAQITSGLAKLGGGPTKDGGGGILGGLNNIARVMYEAGQNQKSITSVSIPMIDSSEDKKG